MSLFSDLTLPGSFRVSHGPGLVWSDERSRATEFMRLFVFSYATLSGSNWAEVAPASGFARNAVSLEAMTAQIYLAVVIARLVGLHVTPSGPRRRSPISCTDCRLACFNPTALSDDTDEPYRQSALVSRSELASSS
jgi:hypothetical protein